MYRSHDGILALGKRSNWQWWPRIAHQFWLRIQTWSYAPFLLRCGLLEMDGPRMYRQPWAHFRARYMGLWGDSAGTMSPPSCATISHTGLFNRNYLLHNRHFPTWQPRKKSCFVFLLDRLTVPLLYLTSGGRYQTLAGRRQLCVPVLWLFLTQLKASAVMSVSLTTEILLGGECVSKSTPLVVELPDSRFTLCAIVVLRSRLASQISSPIPWSIYIWWQHNTNGLFSFSPSSQCIFYVPRFRFRYIGKAKKRFACVHFPLTTNFNTLAMATYSLPPL